MEQLRSITLAAAVVTVGLTAGVVFTYATSVMLALRHVDDRTFIDVMQKINVAIINGWFVTAFAGGLVTTIAAVLLHLGAGQRGRLPWLIAAVVLYVAAILVTGAINVPLNNQLEAAGPVAGIPDLAAVRASFESSWVRWNVVRTVSATGSLLALAFAMLRR